MTFATTKNNTNRHNHKPVLSAGKPHTAARRGGPHLQRVRRGLAGGGADRRLAVVARHGGRLPRHRTVLLARRLL